MSFTWIIHVTNFYQILLFSEQISYGKYYPLMQKTVHHYIFLKTKSRLDTVTEASVKFAQAASPA